MARRCPSLEQAALALAYVLHTYFITPFCRAVQGCYETVEGGRSKRRQLQKHRETLTKIRQEWESLQPKPLPASRPRRLTQSPVGEKTEVDDTIIEEDKDSVSQEGSPFLTKLPLDIRREIYRHVIGYGPMHIARAKGRLGHVRCKVRNSPFPKDRDCLEAACYKDEVDEKWGLFKEGSKSNWGILSLSRTCRAIYTETIDDLYSLNTFIFPSATQFLEFSSTVLPQRLNAISRVNVQVNIGKLSLPKPEPDPVHERVNDGVAPPKISIQSADMEKSAQFALHMTVNSQPPDVQWRQAIRLLAGMRSLRVLRVDVECTPHVRFKVRTGLVDVRKTIIQPWADIKHVEVFEIQVGQVLRTPLLELVRPTPQPSEYVDIDDDNWEANLIRDSRGRWELEGIAFPIES